jgi:hypothetical protein
MARKRGGLRTSVYQEAVDQSIMQSAFIRRETRYMSLLILRL